MRIHFLKTGVLKYFFLLLFPLLLNCYVDRNNPYDPHGENPLQLPVITRQPSVDFLTVGQTATLSVVVENKIGLKYQWQKNGIDIPGAVSANYTVPAVTITNNKDIYCCILTNNAGSDTTTNVEIVILPETPGSTWKIAAGYNHSLILKNDHSLWSFGNNEIGQLGDGTMKNQLLPVKIMESVKDISVGEYYSLIVKTDGSAWACGRNGKGQLGDGTTVNRTSFVKIFDNVKNVYAGKEHSFFLKNDGSLWACGSNSSGQLGDGTTEIRLSPVKIMTGVKYVSAGEAHSLILLNDGSLWGCGNNDVLGIDNSTYSLIPSKMMDGVKNVSAGAAHSLILDFDNTLWACGYNGFGQIGTSRSTKKTFEWMRGVKNISAGYYHNLIIKNDGSVWGYGQNSSGQLGIGFADSISGKISLDNVISISAGFMHSLFLKSDGSSWACGCNNDGALGDGTTYSSFTPVKVGTVVPRITSGPLPQTVAEGLSATFSVSAIGNDLKFQWEKNGTIINGANDSVYTTPILTLADNGSVYRCVVSNSAGTWTSNTALLTVIERKMYYIVTSVIGNGTVTPATSDSILIGTVVTLTATPSQFYRFEYWTGSVNGTDNPLDITVSSNMSVVANFVPTAPVIKIHPVDTIKYERETATFTVVAEGIDLQYQWYKNNAVITDATSPVYTTSALDLSNNGETYYCYISNIGGSVKSNDATLLVAKDPKPVIIKHPFNRSVIEGQTATFSVSAEGTNIRFQWQKNGEGISGATDSIYTTPVTTLANNEEKFSCFLSNEFGSVTCSTAVLKVFPKFTNISAGGSHSLFLKSDNSAWGCGLNSSGQLGVIKPELSSKIIKIMDSVQSIAAGSDHSLMLKTDGSLWACGNNNYGQLGDGTIINRFSPVKVTDNVKCVSAGNFYSLILKTDGSVWACGYNGSGQLGIGGDVDRTSPVKVMEDVQNVSAGTISSLFLKTDGSVFVCGAIGMQGIYSSNRRFVYAYTPVIFNSINNETFISISCFSHSLLLKSDGSVIAFGYNLSGQFGNGSINQEFQGYEWPIQMEIENVKTISAGGNHSVLLKADGTAWACGQNSYGQLGNGTTTEKYIAVKIDLESVKNISAGNNHTVLLKTDGTAWACGLNEYGQLGEGSTSNRLTPVPVLH